MPGLRSLDALVPVYTLGIVGALFQIVGGYWDVSWSRDSLSGVQSPGGHLGRRGDCLVYPPLSRLSRAHRDPARVNPSDNRSGSSRQSATIQRAVEELPSALPAVAGREWRRTPRSGVSLR